MKDKLQYIPKEERKKILLLSDDITMSSGVGNMGKEIVINTAHHFNWVNLGAALKHFHAGKVYDLSPEINTAARIEDSNVILIPNSGYGTPDQIRALLNMHKPDAIMIFTDPRYWVWLFDMERELRSQIPILYLNIWDNYPAPLYNKSYYNSVDLLMAISQQTKVINEVVLGDKAKNKVIEYVPHGCNPELYKPISEAAKTQFKKDIFGDKEYDFILFFNSRNIKRKSPADTILAFREFCDNIGKRNAKKCALVMHTQPFDQNGTDLYKVREAICDNDYVNVIFSTHKVSVSHLNSLYNIADATVLLSSNEGWGLALTESVLAGTMIIANVTGGMQDQMRFADEKGKWVKLSSRFPSNHRGKYKNHGVWAKPVYPSTITLAGSVPTPYIFDDKCSTADAAKAFEDVYRMSRAERDSNGREGRDWMMGNEANMTATKMGEKVIKSIDKAFDKFKPRPLFDLFKVEEKPKDYITHKI